jgi:hypothetical protein
MSFQTEEMIAACSTMEVRMRLPSFRMPLVLKGTVVREVMKGRLCEFAIEFINVRPEEQAEIDELVLFLRKRDI